MQEWNGLQNRRCDPVKRKLNPIKIWKKVSQKHVKCVNKWIKDKSGSNHIDDIVSNHKKLQGKGGFLTNICGLVIRVLKL